MRWKALLVLAFAWLLLGAVGLHVPESTIGPASLEYAICHCVDRVVVDEAHSPPFLTTTGIVLVYLLPGALLVWLAVFKARPRGAAAIAVLPFVIIGSAFAPWIYEPRGPARRAVRHGDYAIDLPRACRPGAPATTRRVFFKERELTRVAGEFAFSPLKPSRILYEEEPWCTEQPVTTFYFDGARDAPVRVFGALHSAQLSWSPDDRFLVSPDPLVLVDLQTGRSSDLSDFFVGKGVTASHVEFRGWSADGTSLSVANRASYRRGDGSDFSATDLVDVDTATLADRYVDTTDGSGHYRRPEHQRTIDLGGGVSLVETVRGFPTESTEVVIHQALMHDGVVAFESRYATYAISPSPDHRFVVLWNDVNRLAPWRILDLTTRTSVAVQQEDRPGRVPPKFGRWSDDSSAIVIAVDAYERETDANGRDKPDARLVPYRQTYLVEASTGVQHKQQHCQHAGTDNADWHDTPCAGTFRD